MSVRTGEAAWAWARAQVGRDAYHNLCKAFVRTAFNVVPSQSGTAKEAWAEADHRHFTSNPEAVPAFVWAFMNTSASAEHAVITGPKNAAGHRLCVSVDAGPGGTIALIRLDTLADRWGPVVGWAEDIDGQRIWTPPAPKPKPPTGDAAKNSQMWVHIRNEWYDGRQADRATMLKLERTNSPAYADKCAKAGRAIDQIMRDLLT